MRQHSRRCMTALWLAVAPATLLITDACSPNAGYGQSGPLPWSRFTPYRPGLVRIGPGGGPVLSDMPSYGAASQPSAPSLPTVFLSLKPLCDQRHSKEWRTNVALSIQTGQQMDTYPEYDVAFAGIPILPEFQNGRSTGFVTGWAAGYYAECIADARGGLGDFYFFGIGVAQDYAEAARWYEKSLNTKMPPESGSISQPQWQMQLGVLYAYGLGVPKDPQRARQLWSGSADLSQVHPRGSTLTRLMNYNALPKTMGDWDNFQEEIKIVDAKVEEKEVQNQALAEQQREREEVADLKRRRTAWTALPQADRNRQCVSECQPKAAACHSHNTDNAWGSMWSGGASLGSLMRADMTSTDCSRVYNSCMDSCSAGP